jgi:hypothetical protein
MSSIQIAGMDGLFQKLRGLPGQITAAVSAEIQDGAQSIAAEAKQRAPGDQGLLRNEIGAIKVNATTWQVVSGAEYSPFVEFGTLEKVQIPPGLEEFAAQFKGDFSSGTLGAGSALTAKEAIFNWCERQGIDQKLWYPIYVSIMVHGTAPQPFFFPAALRQEPIILDRIKLALKGAI